MNEYQQIVSELDTKSFTYFSKRSELIKKYSWAIPSDDAIALCVKYSPIVEIGAGNGYLASLIQSAGGIVHAYDRLPPVLSWCSVTKGNPISVELHQDCSLFLCWPPFDDSMAFDSLLRYRGNTVIYFGEGRSGCTGDDAFHDFLERDWDLVERLVLPKFLSMHDDLFVYTRSVHVDLST